MTKKIRITTLLFMVLTLTGLCACHTTVNINSNADMSEVTEVPEEEIKSPEEVEKEQKVKLPQLESVPFDLTEYAEDGKRKIFESYGNSYLLTADSKKDYPKLAEALEAIDENEKAIYTESIKANKEDAEEFAKEQDGYGQDYSYFRYSETQLKAADEKVVSMLRTEYGFTGGAHPDYFYQAFNLDPRTGNDIPLSDIITDKNQLKTVLKDKLNIQYPDGNFFDLDESLGAYELDADSTDPDNVTYVFTIDPAGLTFYFGPYDLNSYADGSQQVDVFFSDIPSILKAGFVYEGYEDEGLGDWVPEEAENDDILSQNPFAIKGPDYTGTSNIKKENNDDGTYRYEDMTQDGITVITNMCAKNSQRDGQDPDAYAENFVCVEMGDDVKIDGSKSDDKLSAALTYPVYTVTWENGSNEDTKQGIGAVVLTDSFTYYFGYSCPIDSFEENESFYKSEMEKIEMIDLK